MFEEYKYKTELHAHTSPVSGCSHILPEHLVDTYVQRGFTSIAITNHFMYDKNKSTDPAKKIEYYLNDYYKAKKYAEKYGLNIILGCEARVSENENDYLIYGIRDEDLYKIEAVLDNDIIGFYKAVKNDTNMIFQAHPFRDGMVRADLSSIDGIEAFNLHPTHNSRVGVAARYAREHNLQIICGSDYHDEGCDALCSILTKEEIKDSIQLADILKKKEYIIEISGYKLLLD